MKAIVKSEGSLINRKQTVRRQFNNHAHTYESAASLQKNVAERLIDALRPWQLTLPPGPVIELGAGTGFYTRHLIDTLPDTKIHITDVSENMLNICRTKFSGHPNVQFSILDAEDDFLPPDNYSMITGNFVVQWFNSPAEAIVKLSKSLKSGGLLLLSFPGEHSFTEWKEVCNELSFPYTGNDMPNIEEIVIKLSTGPCQIDYYEDSKFVKYDSCLDFFKNLKELGASTPMHDRQLSPGQFRQLLEYWDGNVESPVTVTYHVVFLAVRRD